MSPLKALAGPAGKSLVTGAPVSWPTSVVSSSEKERVGALDAAGYGLRAVEVERDVAALAESSAIEGELNAHLVFARGDGVSARMWVSSKPQKLYA